MSAADNTTVASALKADGLPVGKLLAFTMAGFLAIMTETMPAGLLPQIGRGLGVSEALAGQLVTLYALGSVLALAVAWSARTHGFRPGPNRGGLTVATQGANAALRTARPSPGNATSPARQRDQYLRSQWRLRLLG